MRLPGRRTVAAAAAVLAMAAVTVSIPLYSIQVQAQTAARVQQQHDSYAESNRHDYDMGQTVRLDSAEDLEGSDVGYCALFDWKGTLEATLLSADYYDSFESTRLDSSKLFLDMKDMTNAHVLVCRMKLKNVDAQYREGRDFIDWDAFPLYVDGIADVPPNNGPALCYFDGTMTGADLKHLLDFQLLPGQEQIFTLAYSMPDSYRNHPLYYSIGNDSVDVRKYNIYIDHGSGQS